MNQDGSAVLPSGGAWLRLLLFAATLGLGALAWRPTPVGALGWLEAGVVVALALACALRPDSAVPLVVLGAAITVRIFGGAAVLDGNLLGLVVCVPLVHQVAALAAVVPPTADLRLRAVLPSAIRWTVSVLASLAVLGLGVATGLLAFD
jgi:hypothetical protein